MVPESNTQSFVMLYYCSWFVSSYFLVVILLDYVCFPFCLPLSVPVSVLYLFPHSVMSPFLCLLFPACLCSSISFIYLLSFVFGFTSLCSSVYLHPRNVVSLFPCVLPVLHCQSCVWFCFPLSC